MTESFTQNDAAYNQQLQQGLKLSGENKDFFIQGRLKYLQNCLPVNMRVIKILDFGCGLGETSAALLKCFPEANVTGVDLSDSFLESAANHNTPSRLSFQKWNPRLRLEPVDLCYTNGVFHHIEPADRGESMAWIFASLRAGGIFAFFENNPWNLGTRLVMERIPFDRDAKPLSMIAAKRLLAQAGFKVLCARTLFYFPSFLKGLRRAENFLSLLPLGAQYLVLAQK